MRRRGVAGLTLGAVLALGGLAGCSGESGPPVLTWYTNPDAGGQDRIAAECTEAADGAYVIETAGLPREASSQRDQLARRLAAHDASIDLMSLDPPFVPELANAGFLAPVPDDVAQRVSQDVVAGALTGATWEDQLVALPFWANTQLLWYRTSVAKEAGIDPSKPVTWDQLIDAVSGSDHYLGVQGTRAESLTVWINALIEGAGGHIVPDPTADATSVNLGLDSDAGREAARIMSEIGRGGLGGPGLPTADENATFSIFQGDHGSFMVNWPFVWPAMKEAVDAGQLDKAVLDDVGWAMYPATVEGQPSRPPLGGIDIGVGAYSKHTDLAYQAAECIVDPAKQAAYFVSDGNPPAASAAYDDPKVRDAFPMADLIRASLEQAAPRPQTPYYNEVSGGLQQTWHPPSSVDPDTTPGKAEDLITAVLRGEQLL